MQTQPESIKLNLADFEKNYQSQGGEDGVIERILLEANITDGYFVEFGAWDGIFLSNTCHLAKKGFSGVFIEGDTPRFKNLQRNYPNSPNLTLINKYVRTSGPDSLSNILKE